MKLTPTQVRTLQRSRRVIDQIRQQLPTQQIKERNEAIMKVNLADACLVAIIDDKS